MKGKNFEVCLMKHDLAGLKYECKRGDEVLVAQSEIRECPQRIMVYTGS